MIFGALFSRNTINGGGSFRRWMKFQRIMNKKRWTELDREPNGPITLFDFAYLDDAIDAANVDESKRKDGWRISDDSVIGGYSSATFQLIRTKDDYQRVMRGESPISLLDQLKENGGKLIEDIPPTSATSSSEEKVDEKENNEESSDESNESTTDNKKGEEAQGDDDNEEDIIENNDNNDEFIPFIRWKGTIDTRVNDDETTMMKNENIQRSGFCAIRSPEFPFGGANLGGRYDGIEIMCRSDGRPYSVNLLVETFIPDDMYQCFISIPPTIEPNSYTCPNTGGRFDRVILLFRHFIVTSGGKMRARQRDLDTLIKLQSIGFTIMDGRDGDFQFDLARIRAVNCDEKGVIGTAD